MSCRCIYCLLHRPVKNTQTMSDPDLIEKILTVAYQAEFTPVIFKILGTLRMLVNGQGQWSSVT